MEIRAKKPQLMTTSANDIQKMIKIERAEAWNCYIFKVLWTEVSQGLHEPLQL